jgi:hypothetical protein
MNRSGIVSFSTKQGVALDPPCKKVFVDVRILVSMCFDGSGTRQGGARERTSTGRDGNQAIIQVLHVAMPGTA